MTSISAKILEAFKNLKSDAKPSPPRPPRRRSNSPQSIIIDDVTDENLENEENLEPDDITVDDEEFTEDEVPNPKKNVKKSGKSGKKKQQAREYSCQTSAMGNVINIFDSEKIHVGSTIINHHHGNAQPSTSSPKVELTPLVKTLLESKDKPAMEYLDYIAKNQGKNWHSFYRTLKFSQGKIETFEIDFAKYGVSEARYRLLLEWVRNDKVGTLGLLATKLWEADEKHIVKKLASMYHKQNTK